MRDGVGTLVAGRYLLAEAVGQGGMGRVWRGHDQLLDRVVAVKEVILPSQAPRERAESLARTMREARAAARIDHPGVITIHDVVEHEGSPWIVMQFVAGTSLRARIEREGCLPWAEVADIGGQVAEALTAAHAAGIVHRDLKPDNILLADGRVIVTDFGIARIMDSATQLTSTGMLVGTPAYMAPEQLDGGGIGPAADLWALGATLYTAVEGTPPFAGATMSVLIAAILTKMPTRPGHAGPLLEEVLAGLLAKDPARRPDAVAAARALAACGAGKAVRDPAASLRPSPTAAGGGQASRFLGTAASTPPPGAYSHPSFPGMQWPSASRTESVFIPQPPSSPVPVPVRERQWRLKVSILSAAAVFAAVAGGGAALLVHGHHSPGIAASSTRSPAGQHPGATTPIGPVTTSLLATLNAPQGQSPDSIAFGPDGTLAVGDFNGSTYLWNTSTKAVIDTFTDPNSQGVSSVAFGPNGTLAVGDLNGSTYQWSTTIKSVINSFTDPNPQGGGVGSVAFGPNGTLAVGDVNGSTYLWNTTTGTLIATLPSPNGARPLALAFGPDGTLAVVNYIGGTAGADRGSTYLWNTTTKTVIAILSDPKGRAPRVVAFGPDGTLAVGDENGSTYLWNTAARSVIATFSASQGQGYPVAVGFAPNDTLAVADTTCTGACLGGAVPSATYLWNTTTERVIATLPIPEGFPPQCLAWGPGGTLAVGAANGSTYLWRVSTGKS